MISSSRPSPPLFILKRKRYICIAPDKGSKCKDTNVKWENLIESTQIVIQLKIFFFNEARQIDLNILVAFLLSKDISYNYIIINIIKL